MIKKFFEKFKKLPQKEKIKLYKILIKIFLFVCLFLFILIFSVIIYYSSTLPTHKNLENYTFFEISKLYDNNDKGLVINNG